MIKGLPYSLKRDFDALKHNNVYVLNLGFEGAAPQGHWFYFPEEKYPFYRVGVQSAFAQNMTPKNCTSLYVEFAFPQNAKKPDLKKLESQTIALLKTLGFIGGESQILVKNWLYIPFAYPIEDAQYARARANIIDWLASQNIYLTGRYGAWEYSFMERSLLCGKETAEILLKQ
jgi:protoporphyrinogen oxidase